MPNQIRDQNSGSMINQKFNEAFDQDVHEAKNPNWAEIDTPPDGMRIENPDLQIVENKNAEIKTMNQPSMKIYTCPMHPEVKTNEPGRCPVCGMELMEKKINTDE